MDNVESGRRSVFPNGNSNVRDVNNVQECAIFPMSAFISATILRGEVNEREVSDDMDSKIVAISCGCPLHTNVSRFGNVDVCCCNDNDNDDDDEGEEDDTKGDGGINV